MRKMWNGKFNFGKSKLNVITIAALSFSSIGYAHPGNNNSNVGDFLGNVFNAQNKRIVLNVQGLDLHGRNQIVPLKRLAKVQYPQLSLRQFNLKKVKVFAYSNQGFGNISLRVGPVDSYPQIADRYYYQFNKLVFINSSYNSNGVWQLVTNGNIHINKIVLVMSRKYNTGNSEDGYGRGYGQGNDDYNFPRPPRNPRNPRNQGQVSCSSNMLTARGRVIASFNGMSYGFGQMAKRQACGIAFNKCQASLNQKHQRGQNPYARCVMGR